MPIVTASPATDTPDPPGCIALPHITLPAIPGITLAPTLPSPEITIPGICCLLPNGLKLKITIPLPKLTITVPFVTAIAAALETVEAYLDSLVPRCMRQ